jgi:excisionase family DNA binding protein
MATFQISKDYVTVTEAARLKGVSRAAIYQAIREGRLRHHRISGATTVLARKDVDAFEPRVRRRPSPDPRPIWEAVAEIGREIPDEEWAKLPNDASKNLDHYLYGAPKVDE